MHIRHLINGEAVDSRDRFETLNPANQQVLAEVAAGGEAEVHAAVAAAKAAFPKWAATPAPERAKMMHRLGELITQHVAEIAAIETSVLKTASMYSERLNSMNARLPSMTTEISKRMNRL